MRAPDHDAGTGGSDASGADSGAGADGKAAEGGSDDTLLGGAADADSGAGDQGADGDKKVQPADGDPGKDADDKDPKDDGEPDADGDVDPADAEVPEAYKLDPITIGEGDDAQTVEIDTKLLEDVTPLLKDAGITQGAAKKLAPAVIRVQEQVMASLTNEHAAMRADWEKQAREDKDIGGAKLDETLALAAKALDKFGARSDIQEIDGVKVETNEFRRLLNETGLGNHPVMLKMFREIGKLVGEDEKLEGRDAAPASKQDRLEVLYPDDVPKNK